MKNQIFYFKLKLFSFVFLIACFGILHSDYKTKSIDKIKCIAEFEKCYNKEKALIEWIKTNRIKVLNSGIKIALTNYFREIDYTSLSYDRNLLSMWS